MSYPEILQRWNSRDWAYFTGRDKITKNGIVIYDDMEVIYHAIVKFLEYACEHDMRLITSVDYGTIGAIRYDRDVTYTYKLVFDHTTVDDESSKYTARDLHFHEVAKWNPETHEYDMIGKHGYVLLYIHFDHETNIHSSATEVIFGNVSNIDYDIGDDYHTSRNSPELRDKKRTRVQICIDKIKRFIKQREDINAWLILQGINFND